MLDDADKAERGDSPRDTPAKFVKLDDRCELECRAASLDEPGMVMGRVEKLDGEPVRSRSAAGPSRASVVLLSRFEDDGVEPPELWLRSRRPNSVLYMTSRRMQPTSGRISAFLLTRQSVFAADPIQF